MPATYEKIQSTTLGSAVQSINFTSIPATYTDLRVVIANAFTSNTAAINMRFNTDAGANYSCTQLSGNGTVAYSDRSTSQNYARLIGLDYATSTTIPHMCTVDIFSYAGSTFKTLLSVAASDKNGVTGAIENIVNLWRSTSAINAIEVRSQSGTLAIGTTATIYGILKA